MNTSTQVIDVLADATKDKFPQIPDQLDNTVVLQRGLKNTVTGSWERNAEVRELNGYDEERISSLESRKNITYLEYISEVIKMGTVSIGDVDFKDRVDQLTLGDRNSLFLAIVTTTYGREKTIDHVCPSCEKLNKVTIDIIDDFPLQVPDFDPTQGLKVVLKDGMTVRLRPPTAEDSSIVSKNAITSAAQTSLMIARCCEWDAGEAPTDPEAWAKSLGMADRRKLITALSEIKMGPKIEEVDVDCVHCGAQMSVMINLLFLLLN